MGSTGGEASMTSGSSAAPSSEATVEIKIKTLDSQTYTMRVDKCVPVPALKEQIATVTGILSEQQRLICRGKVLKDDTLLSAYHVEDGHTLHLVVRQPIPPSSEGLPDHPATDSMSSADHSHSTSVLVGTFNISDQGDGALPDLGRIVSAVLSSFGVTDVGSGGEGANMQIPALERLSRAGSLGGLRSSSRQQSNHTAPAAGEFPTPLAFSANSMQPPVIPDSLTTLSQYLSRLRQELGANVGVPNNPSQAATARASDGRSSGGLSGSAPMQGAGGLPTPASLAELLLSTRQFLNEQAEECLLQLTRQIEDHTSVTSPAERMGIQSNALRVGALLQNLGALLLELGRTTMTLRIGQTPAEAVVNAGPAVFISTSGPNPLMVQPLPFQPGASFGAVPMGTAHAGSGLSSGSTGSGFLPRNIDIRIRAGSVMPSPGSGPGEPTSGQPVGQTNSSSPGTENAVNQATSGANESTIRNSGVRVVPLRTVVSAVPATGGRAPTSLGSMGLIYPMLARVHNGHSGNSNGNRGQSSDVPPHGAEANRQSNSRAAAHQQSDVPGADDIRGSLDQFFRTMLANEQIHDISFQGMGTAPVNENVETAHASNSQASSSGAVDDGTFLSNLLRQIMPIVSQNTSVTNNTSVEEDGNARDSSVSADEDSSGRGSSRRREHSEDSVLESSKRQKRE
ncbi:Ubiquitin-like superfamily protein [Heracleum sosnowskyi]|uniref:Ubiquitin-like superfamily protein n=1 Tax=Heracleum sosnowskyi TaxID=360622 RepID=A0AAD8IBR8_9APIA|nr:Ubiquitin-like superfamily protein [Heracleum sosnowskyi]